MKFVNECPSFDDLFALGMHVKELKELVSDLAEGRDVVQRASDLLTAAESFAKQVKLVVLEEE